jgi:hypothetical protein
MIIYLEHRDLRIGTDTNVEPTPLLFYFVSSMPVPDARTRNKISLIPSKILSTSSVTQNLCLYLALTFSSVPGKLILRILLSNVLSVFSIYASKEWLLTYDVGIFWVLMRVLACGGFGVLVWEGFTRQTSKRKTYEVRLISRRQAHWLISLVVGVGYGILAAVRAICMPVHRTISTFPATVKV